MTTDGENVLTSLRREVVKGAAVAAAASIVAGIAAAVTTMLALAGTVIGNIGLTPQNAVLAFALEGCPPGWQDYQQAWGRVVVGAVTPAELDTLANKFAADERGDELAQRDYGEPGGAQQTVLSTANLPSHAHEIIRGNPQDTTNNSYPLYASGSASPLPERPMTEAAGSPTPAAFTNMPPYVALTMCRKI